MNAWPARAWSIERNTKYVPRPDGAPDGTAGPKVAHFDRIEWQIIPDAATVAAAMQNGEIDWWLTPNADLLPLLQKQARLKIETIDPDRLRSPRCGSITSIRRSTIPRSAVRCSARWSSPTT